MATKSYQDCIEDPVLECIDYGKKWRLGKESDGKWANCEILLECNRRGGEKFIVMKDGVKVCSWTKTGFAVKPMTAKDKKR